jgi:hypothetical protein
MTARIDAAISAKDIADARRKARALRPRVAGRRADAKVNVDAGTLQSILKVIDAVSLPGPRRANARAATAAGDEISPQQAADMLRMSRPSVMRLIEKGLLHPRKILSRNKLSRAEVEAYRLEHSRQQREALGNLVALTEEYDL